MRIGTDSISTCIAEGYLMMDYKVRELMPKGKLNPDAYVRIIGHFPDYILADIRKKEKTIGVPRLVLDVAYTVNGIWELYLEHKEGIDSFIGGSHEFPSDPHDVLAIASDINPYCGLN